MRPSENDVQQMVTALLQLSDGIERARRQRPGAGLLRTLQLLAAKEPARTSDLAQELGVHQSSVTRQIQTLVSQGLVRATTDQNDRRASPITITEDGRRELARLEAVGRSRWMQFTADWDAEEVRTLERLVTKLRASIADVNARAPRTEAES
ncbi:MAG: MarR family transcriptional regulator [Streptomyces sp.]|nr:MarR family transcriptional regulator [Streptomyces sp.]NUP44846.1 MarR family transcriptional regulator [Streptomyces sp.]